MLIYLSDVLSTKPELFTGMLRLRVGYGSSFIFHSSLLAMPVKSPLFCDNPAMDTFRKSLDLVESSSSGAKTGEPGALPLLFQKVAYISTFA